MHFLRNIELYPAFYQFLFGSAILSRMVDCVRRTFSYTDRTLLEQRRTLNVNIKGPPGPFYGADLKLYDTGHIRRVLFVAIGENSVDNQTQLVIRSITLSVSITLGNG
uniref:Uncharacterized protein n=1 Tax=Magallana gigas TaxID=29159 RepID=K1PUF2_MAGGI